jgi:hypothetical protein
VLAKELDLTLNGLFRVAKRAGVPITRGGALVSEGQVGKIRNQLLAEEVPRATPRPTRGPATRAGRRFAVMPVAVAASPAVTAEAQRPPGSCNCCGLSLSRLAQGRPGVVANCRECLDHAETPGESTERLLERLHAHERRLLEAYLQERAERLDRDERMRAALTSRDSWRDTLVAVMDGHESRAGSCRCGAKKFPCSTWQTLEKVNKGVTRQVERILSQPDDDPTEDDV